MSAIDVTRAPRAVMAARNAATARFPLTRVLCVAAALLGAGTAAAQELINCGVSLPDHLLAGTTKQYTVDVPPGATVAVNVSDTSGVIGLLKLKSGSDETCIGTLMLTQPGLALVEVSDCLDGDSGPFTISSSIVSDHERNCGHPLVCGAILRVQEFRYAGEVDPYIFAGMPGDQVTVTAMDVSGTIGFVRLRIFDPDGQLVSEADSCRSSNKVLTLTKAGRYTALASACGLPSTGEYGVALEGSICPTGPDVTYLGVALADGRPLAPYAYVESRPAFQVPSGAGFSLVIEGRAGSSGQPPGIQAFNWNPADPTVLPDLQVLLLRPLGNGSPAVCDNMPPVAGGVPGFDPIEFAGTQAVADAINDFGCRVADPDDAARGVTDAARACTHPDGGAPNFVDPTTTVQFCAPITPAWAISPPGTVVAVRLRDVDGALGTPYEMVVSPETIRPCAGDCDGNREVSINELITAVGIELGSTALDRCTAVDANRDGTVQINELIQGMNSVMTGCPPS